MIRAAVIAAALIACAPIAASAQVGPPGRVEISAGLTSLGEMGLGTADASLTTPGGTGLVLFRTSTSLERSAGLDVRIGAHAWRNLDAEAFASFSHPRLATTVANDIENADTVTASETIEQYVIGAGALWYLTAPVHTARFKPFVAGSVAYLRQLHAANTLAVTGRVIDGGVGAKYLLLSRATGRLNSVGLRGDARLAARSKGVAFDGDVRYGAALTISLFARF